MEPMAAAVAELRASPGAALVERAALGDADAFEQLIAPRVDRVFRIARAMLGNDADAHDASQEALVAAWRELPRLRDAGLFDVWLRRIIVNACRGKLRGRRRVREITLDPALDVRVPGMGMADALGQSDALARAFDRLDADKRALLVLHHLEHEPVASIAQALGIPVGTAKWRLADARSALARALIAEGEGRA